jgi:amino acid adenylation domain-containing protein
VRDDSPDSFPASSLQQGMLFHSLFSERSGVDIVQEISEFREELDADRFEEAWRRVARRHPALSTRFLCKGVGRPLQQVSSCDLSLERFDWTSRSEAHQEADFGRFLRSDRLRDFDLERAPLMRLSLFRVAGARYRFVWTFHHALMDGWCIPLVLKDVFAAYEALRERRAPDVSPVKTYRDYIEWLSRLDSSKAEPFWRAALAGFRAPTPLGVDRPAPKDVAKEPYGEEEIRISERCTSSLREIAERHDVRLATFLQAAWACLLARYSGEADVVFGATRQCRPDFPGAETIVGLFINTLPLRARVSPGVSVLDLLRDLRSQWLASREHRHTSLLDVQGWSDVPRGNPLFESIAVFENALMRDAFGTEGKWANRTFRYVSQPNTPLNVVAYGEPELLIRISYDRARFDRGTVTRMLRHVATLLEAMSRDVAREAVDLPLLTDAELGRLEEWGRTKEYPSEEPVHRGFERWARRNPAAAAVEFQGTSLTYGELNRRANRLAAHLREMGVAPNVLVGVCLERSLEMVIALIAVLKAGGAYVPLDPAYPTDRLAFMLEDCAAPVLVTESVFERLFSDAAEARVCLLDRDAEEIARLSGEDPESHTSPDDLAYVIYTSGSTGKPKGVLVSHRNLTRLFTATEEIFGFDERDAWTLFHSYAFDFSVWEMWGALRYGGRLVVVPAPATRSPEAFRELLSERAVTVLNQTPSAFRQLIEADSACRSPLSLRLVIFGGEALDTTMLAPWFERYGDGNPRLVNMYGITETTVHVTHHRLSRADAARPTNTIGRPIPDLRVRILDRLLRQSPIGVAGEIHVGGAGVARGYLNRPDLDRERFVPDPFAVPGARRLYRSGDLARYDEHGRLEYLGRADHQLKIRGHRVEPGEVEAVLLRHAGVEEALVAQREESAGDVRLVAYVVAGGAPAVAEAELRALMRESLPAYMIPSAIVWLERLPRTPTGKIDRRGLPAATPADPRRAGEFIPPRNATERAVAEIWAAVLGVEALGANDSFFERGGHSLLATQVLSRVRDHFRLEIPIRALFDFPTVAAFSATVLDAGRNLRSDASRNAPIPRRARIPESLS